MANKTRSELYSNGEASFDSGGLLAENNSTGGFLTNLKISVASGIDGLLNRSVWLRTMFYQTHKAFMHKDEDRATAIGVMVTLEPTTKKYVTVEQLPDTITAVDDFTVSAVQDDGALLNNQAMFELVGDNSGTNRVKILSFSTFGIKWLKARTWLESEIVALITTTVNNPTGGGLIPVGTVWDYTGAYNVDPSGFLNLCNEYSGSARSISNTAGTGTLHDDKYQALFLHLWTNFANTECPVSSGRGASAAADWAANKDIKLPDYRGRVGGYYKNADANFGTLGKQIGTDLIEAAHLPLNSPWNAVDSGHIHGVFGKSDEDGNTGATNFGLQDGTGNTATTNSSSANISMTTNVSADRKHFQPTIIQTAIIKY